MRLPPHAEKYLPPAGVVLLLVLWELAIRLFQVSPFVLPSPSAVANSVWAGAANGVYLKHGMLTAAEALLGFALALAAGVGLGALIAEVRLLERAFYPLLVAL